MMLDFISGFFDIKLGKDKKSKLGMFGKALGAGVAGGAVDNTPLPAMAQPERVSKETNPSFATITTQLKDLVKTANKIGVYTKEQQEAILNQINQAKRVAKEQQLENKTPVVPELPEATDSNNLGPLDTSVSALIEKIDELSETVDGLSNGSMGGMGGLPMGMSRGRRPPRTPQPSIVRSATSPTGYRYAAGSGRGGQFAKAPSWLGRATAAISGSGSAMRVAAPIAAAAASTKIAGLMTAGFKSARSAGGSIKAAVRRAAGPIIAKALGRTVLKSIPLVGVGVGAAYAVSRLMQGDVTGATVELGSGVAGPLTAIPALGAAVTRDTYASVYGIQPEQDPNFKKRYGELKGAIDEMIKEQLSGAVKPMSAPTASEIGDAETPARPPQAAPAAQPPAIPAPASPAGASGGGSGSNASSDASSTGGAGSSSAGSAAMGSSAAAGGASSAQPVAPEPKSGTALTSPVMETNTNAMSGAALTAQEIPVASNYQDYGYNPTSGTFMPQTGNTTRGAAQGIGSIPDPAYSASNLEGLMRTLFFNS